MTNTGSRYSVEINLELEMSRSQKNAGSRRVRRKKLVQKSMVVEGKLKELEKVVPGCEELDAEDMLKKTAEYIALLQFKVVALRVLSKKV